MHYEQVRVINSDVLNEVLFVRKFMEGQDAREDVLKGLLLIESWEDVIACCDFGGIFLG